MTSGSKWTVWLKSWAVPKGPSHSAADKRLAVFTEDHPFEYASFEGVIPEKQYGAGEVIVWDCGVYSPDEDQQVCFHDRAEAERRVRMGLEKGKLRILLRGEKLKGSFALVRTADAKQWLLLKHKDRFAQQFDIAQHGGSVLSRMRVEEVVGLPVRRQQNAAQLAPNGPVEALPKKLSPMLAEPGDAPSNDPNWLYEPKLDGYRVLAFIEANRVTLRSRRGLDLTPLFPTVAAELAAQSVDGMVLDGEIVAFGKDGSLLQRAAEPRKAQDRAGDRRRRSGDQLCFLLLRPPPLRRTECARCAVRGSPPYLSQCLLPSAHVQLIHTEADGESLYRAALAHGFEGIVAKRRDSVYKPGQRASTWRKIKSTRTDEFIIGGYTKGKGAREPLGALLLGYWDRSGALRYAGHCGSGFDDASVSEVKRRCDEIKTPNSPFAKKPPLKSATTWVKPKLACEVEYAEWTEGGHLRAPVFLRLRDDIEPARVRREPGQAVVPKTDARDRAIAEVMEQLKERKPAFTLVVGREQIKLTNLDRVYWPARPMLDQPALTKRDLLRYLARASQAMLPHLADRPLTMIRMPEGITGERFFQKHWEVSRPDFVDTVEVFSEHKDEQHEYLVCNNLPTLLWLAQVGTLEYHVWHSRTKPGSDSSAQSTDFSSSLAAMERSVLNYPDYLVFDIDPYIYSGKEGPGAEPELNTIAFEKGKEVAFWLRDLLVSMALPPIVKTSGKTGLHVFVPIERTIDFDAARQACEMVGRHLMQQHPKDITMEWSVNKRTGKIFIDYNMNVRGKTLNVAYSPRGVPGAPVSMPLSWDELADAHPLQFRLTNVLTRLEADGDRWHNALLHKHNLEHALNRKKA